MVEGGVKWYNGAYSGENVMIFQKKEVRHMFMGEFFHTMDAKGRVIIPAKMREELGERCIITRAVADKCLIVYTEEGFKGVSESLKAAKKVNSILASKLSRLLFGTAQMQEFDKQGRVLIPATLREYAGIDKEAVIVGTNDRVEIWSKANWNSFYEDIAAEALEQEVQSYEGFDF